MKIYETEGSKLKYKWQADEMLDVYTFCDDLLEYSYSNYNEYWELPEDAEDFKDHFKRVIIQIETHLINIHLNLFHYPAYSLFHYYELMPIYQLYWFTILSIDDPKFIKTLRKISNKKINQGTSHLNEYEQMVLVFMKSMVLYGIYHEFKNYGFDTFKLEQKRKRDKAYFNLIKKDISKIYSNLSDEPRSVNNEPIRILFQDGTQKRRALIYFNKVNYTILENGLFKEPEMFKNFIKSLETGYLDRDLVFEFNTTYLKKIIVKIIDIANPFFKNNARIGEYYFIKNSNQFKYGHGNIKAANWDAASNDNIFSNSVEEQLLNSAKSEYKNLASSIRFEIDSIYEKL